MSGRLAVAANVAGARPFGRRLFFEIDALALIQLVEATLHGAAMKKPLLPAIVADEPEPSIANESLDGTTRHPSLLERARVRAEETDIKFRSTGIFDEIRGFTTDQPSSTGPGSENEYASVQNRIGDSGLVAS